MTPTEAIATLRRLAPIPAHAMTTDQRRIETLAVEVIEAAYPALVPVADRYFAAGKDWNIALLAALAESGASEAEYLDYLASLDD